MSMDNSYLGDVVALRRSLHAQPELAYAEHRTAERIASWLRALGMQVECGIGGTGVVGVLQSGKSARTIGFRADMDALPIHEETGLPHASREPGRMHACGHDGHVAMLLGAATVLARETGFDGRVVLIFQPAEEGGAGAQRMINEGLFERYPVDAVFALHNWPDLPQGHFAVRPGPIMGSSLRFRVTVQGRGAHAATPHHGIDPVPVVCSIVQSFQTLVARECSATDAVVISVTQLGGGTAANAVPGTAWLAGTARFSRPKVEAQVREAMLRCAQGIAQAHGATARLEIEGGYPATINSAKEAKACASVMRELVGGDRVIEDLPVCLTTEDFGYMLAARPGVYALLGAGRHTGEPGLHHPAFDFNDDILPIGIDYWVRLARSLLNKETA
jgi:amidohydrolase